ncbi:MAG: hypothetical protein AAGJ28_02475 [Pseudomonadota bacterium]
MGSIDRIRDLLPSLWRPEEESRDLIARLLAAAGLPLDRANKAAGDLMQAHWVRFADSALTSSYVGAYRKAAKQPPLIPGDKEVEEHPYIDDLARLAGLLDMAPFTDPLDGKETVEEFRRRIHGTVALWRNGLATKEALVGAARLALSGTDDRGVTIEEYADLPGKGIEVDPGWPDGLVGPLMRWKITTETMGPTQPEVLITGQKAEPGRIAATIRPMIELFDPRTGTGYGVGYNGTVPPEKTLALRGGYSSWLGGPKGVRRASSAPTEDRPADPTAPGRWTKVSKNPDHPVAAMAHGADKALWVAMNNGDKGELRRHDGRVWIRQFQNLPQIHCLIANDEHLIIGHDKGFSFADVLAETPNVKLIEGHAVHDMSEGISGRVFAATPIGPVRFDKDGGLVPIGPATKAETQTPVTCVLAEDSGIVHFGGEKGIFRYDSTHDLWHVYTGHSLDENVPDWMPWDPATDDLPQDADIFLPPVLSLLRGPDTSLWIGTTHGLACWGALRRRRTYATRLSAFPDLGTAAVHALAVDARQRIWAGTERGLLVHDGHDWFQEKQGLDRLPGVARLGATEHWRFDRAESAWQKGTAGGAGGFAAEKPDVITANKAAVNSILWTDTTIAQIGTVEDGTFKPSQGSAVQRLIMRIKPDPTRIVTGGLPALPRIADGTGNWRYLSMEQPDDPLPKRRPAWTREGRLLPPPNTHAAPVEGRFLGIDIEQELAKVFAFDAAAEVSIKWRPKSPLTIIIRLARRDEEDTLPESVLDRVYAAINQVRPAGAHVRLAFGETVVRGGPDG